jgi:hypothetical protein
MQILEKLLIGILLGMIFPILGFLAGWWGMLPFLPERLLVFSTLLGLSLGLLVDAVYLRKWVSRAYDLDLKVWMVVYLFYAIGMFGLFMGVPVFHLILALPAGLFIGSKLAHQDASLTELKPVTRKTCLFTTAVLAVVCTLSAAIALIDPYTASSLQGMFGLPFEITRGMLVELIVVGGITMLGTQWLVVSLLIRLTYAWWSKGKISFSIL